MAKKHTDEPAGKKSGGALKWIKKGQMVKEFENAVFSMKKGQISQPIKTKFGYHIIYVEDTKQASIATLKKFESKIASELIQKDRDIKELIMTAKNDILKSMKSIKSLNKMKKKYGVSIKENVAINKLEGLDQNYSLSEADTLKIFTKTGEVHSFDEALKTTFFLASANKDKDLKVYNFESSINIEAQANLKSMLDNLSEKYTFKRNKLARLPN